MHQIGRPGVLRMVLHGRPNAAAASRRYRTIAHHVGDGTYPPCRVRLAKRGSQIHFNTVGGG